MAVTHRPDLASLARGFHALSDPTRLAIVGALSGGERCVCELTGSLDASQPRLSFHLRVLREAGIITGRREGRWMYYALNDARMEELQDLLCRTERWPHTGAALRACC